MCVDTGESCNGENRTGSKLRALNAKLREAGLILQEMGVA
jgi:hypothetical protein